MSNTPLLQLTGASILRRVVSLCNGMREDFNDRFTPAQLLTLWMAYRHCAWDTAPDTWAERQVLEALVGIVPTWDSKTEKPTYGPLKARTTFDVETGAIRPRNDEASADLFTPKVTPP